MKVRLLRIVDVINSSLWFYPSVIVLGCILLAFGLTEVDHHIDPDVSGLAWLAFGGGPEGGRGVLTSIAGSMMTVTGVTFSITIVVLALAAQQYTPRILREFMSDRGNQVVLGGFLGTWIYAILVLKAIRNDGFGQFVPHFAIAVGILLALVSLGLLIYFIHHIAVSIQPSYIVAQISDETCHRVKHLFPEPLGEGAAEEEAEEQNVGPDGPVLQVFTTHSGYLTAVDSEELMETARRACIVIRMEHPIGHFVPHSSALVTVWPAHRLSEEVSDYIRDSFGFGRSRTMSQDPEFGVLQIVDIAVKALSPGINDPTTAITCLDYLGVVLRDLGPRVVPSRYRKDPETGEVRVIACGTTFKSVTDLAFSEIRRYAEGSTSVLIHMLKVITGVAQQVPTEHRRTILRKHVEMILAASERSVPEPADREAIRERADEALAALSRPRPITSQVEQATPAGGGIADRGPRGGRRAPASG